LPGIHCGQGAQEYCIKQGFAAKIEHTAEHADCLDVSAARFALAESLPPEQGTKLSVYVGKYETGQHKQLTGKAR